MWKPWQWAHGSHEAALANAREAATELSRRRVERDEVELYLAAARSASRGSPLGAPEPDRPRPIPLAA